MRTLFTLLSVSSFAIMWFVDGSMVEKSIFGAFCVILAGVSLFYPEIEASEYR